MMKKITYRLRNNWHPMRWVVLIVGLVFLIQSLRYSDLLSALLGGILLLQAITNTGCLLSRGQCGIGLAEDDSREQKQTNFTEITDN